MSHFSEILASNGLAKHDGRALWRYQLDSNLFQLLQQHLRKADRLATIDARDCALYYAAWWKCTYDGGYPSKQEIFDTIAYRQAFDENAFFQYAKVGARLLGVRWIRNANTQYFRTLLLQGGLPVRHIGRNKGAYTNFLLRILELNPKTIDDFAFDSALTSLLPRSSQNDEIYACCLQVVKAIVEEDQAFLSLMEQDEAMGEISAALKVKKRTLSLIPKKGRVRSFWVFEPLKSSVWLYLHFPEMDVQSFQQVCLIKDVEAEPSYEYKLYYEDKALCKFVRNSAGRYTVIWLSVARIQWDGTDCRPDLYLMTPQGHRHCCAHLVGSMPSLRHPTLWTRYSEGQWLLQRGVNTIETDAIVLYPEAYKAEDGIEANLVELGDALLYNRELKGQLSLGLDGVITIYKTGCASFDWYIPDERPAWLQKANMTVVRSKPNLVVYNKQGELEPSAIRRWRSKGELSWKQWCEPMPKGLIEVCMEVDGVQEFDCFFNIGPFDVRVHNSTLLEAELQICTNDFRLQLNESSLVTVISISDRIFRLICTDSTKQPKAIQASLRYAGQSKGVRFEMASPFCGVELIDNNECVVPESQKLLLGNLYGFRMLSDGKPLFIRLYNSRRKDISLVERFTSGPMPLMHLADKILQLFSLCDPLDGKADVLVEVWRDDNRSSSPIKRYLVKRYAQRLDCSIDEFGGALIKTGENEDQQLFAVPLECESSNISLVELAPTDDGFRLSDNCTALKYIVFGEGGKGQSIRPAFLNLSKHTGTTVSGERMDRIQQYCSSLLEGTPEDDYWKQILSYYQICVDNRLPFAAFELLRACSFSSLLAARLFVFLMSYGASEQFVTAECPQLEADLGFCFHWVAKQHWLDAMKWAGCEFGSRHFRLIQEAISSIYAAQHPAEHFSKILRFAMQDQRPSIDKSISPTQKFIGVRSSLGEVVLSGIPSQCPEIPETYQMLLPASCADNLALLVKSPLAVALSIAGKDDCLWSAEGEHIRRNVRYSQQLHPDWYGYAVCHFLSRS